jgi:hypothetical protein
VGRQARTWAEHPSAGARHPSTISAGAHWRSPRRGWQPPWRRRKWLARLTHGASRKKKVAVALARQLAIDLWRWRTGRCTAADLGWTLKPAAATD